jgi:hypothetical protein
VNQGERGYLLETLNVFSWDELPCVASPSLRGALRRSETFRGGGFAGWNSRRQGRDLQCFRWRNKAVQTPAGSFFLKNQESGCFHFQPSMPMFGSCL